MRAESRGYSVAFQVWRSLRRSQGYVAEGLWMIFVLPVVIEAAGI